LHAASETATDVAAVTARTRRRDGFIVIVRVMVVLHSLGVDPPRDNVVIGVSSLVMT
jgi:hypothetical protein